MSLERLTLMGSCGGVHGIQVASSMRHPGPIPNEVQSHTPPDPKGRADLHRPHVYGWDHEPWTWLGWWEWDPNEDDPSEQMVRGVTAFVAPGTHTSDEMYRAARRAYPGVWARLDSDQRSRLHSSLYGGQNG